MPRMRGNRLPRATLTDIDCKNPKASLVGEKASMSAQEQAMDNDNSKNKDEEEGRTEQKQRQSNNIVSSLFKFCLLRTLWASI